MQTAYKFRLYPSKHQEQKLLEVLDKCRYVYNTLLSRLNEQKVIDRGQIQGDGTDLRRIEPELKKVYSKVLQYECYRLFSNLRALAQLKKKGKKVGRLRFKGKGWFKTFTYNQSGFRIIKTDKRCGRLHLSKIGDIKIRMHREIEGEVKQVSIKHYPSGKWYAFVSCEQEATIKSTNNKAIGIDLGIMNFVYDSEGKHIDHPKFLHKALVKLKAEQRMLARKKKGSKNRQKQRIRVAKVYENVKNQRDDFLHKLSRTYVDNYSFIAVEKLNIKGLIRKTYAPRNMLDASWNRFIQFLNYKAVSAGGQVVGVNPRGTTQRCSQCGRTTKKELWNRIHRCGCGLVIDRDWNSAINILQLGLGRAYTPLETGPLLSNRQVQLMNQEALSFRLG